MRKFCAVSYIILLYFISFSVLFCFFFFNDTATTEIYTLSLHDALPISFRLPGYGMPRLRGRGAGDQLVRIRIVVPSSLDRKSTRLNSSHGYISYAVFCLKKKKKTTSAMVIKKRIARRRRA